ncbi:MAG: phage GP46 family protein [Myxococcales bacterium]|jgi:phage gp46-like protein|nr:phage GP46 family protein [Myxococcales bacterium]
MSQRRWTPADLDQQGIIAWVVGDDPHPIDSQGRITVLHNRAGQPLVPNADASATVSDFWSTDELNGRRVLSSSATARGRSVVLGEQGMQSGSGLAVALVQRQRSFSGIKTIFQWRYAGVTSLWQNGSGLQLYGLRAAASDTVTSATISGSAADVWRVVTGSYDWDSRTAALRVDGGSLSASVIGQSVGTPASAPLNPLVGLSSGVAYPNPDQDIAELLAFRESLPLADQQRLEGYLAWIWGLQTRLPSEHPYALAPPMVEVPDPPEPTPAPPPVDGTSGSGGSLLLTHDNDEQEFDLVLSGGNLATDAGLATSVEISLFCDARIGADEARHRGIDDRRGYWADAFSDSPWGSTLWALEQEGVTPEAAQLVEQRAAAALQWLTVRGIAAQVSVSATAVDAVDDQRIELSVQVRRPAATAGLYGELWEASYVVR